MTDDKLTLFPTKQQRGADEHDLRLLETSPSEVPENYLAQKKPVRIVGPYGTRIVFSQGDPGEIDDPSIPTVYEDPNLDAILSALRGDVDRDDPVSRSMRNALRKAQAKEEAEKEASLKSEITKLRAKTLADARRKAAEDGSGEPSPTDDQS